MDLSPNNYIFCSKSVNGLDHYLVDLFWSGFHLSEPQSKQPQRAKFTEDEMVRR